MFKEMMDTIGFVTQCRPRGRRGDGGRTQTPAGNIELIASENIVSPAVMAAMGSVLTNKYAEGYPGHRYYGGCQCVDVVEDITRDRAVQAVRRRARQCAAAFGRAGQSGRLFCAAERGRYRPGHGSFNGGHLTHGSPVNMSGKNYNFIAYGVDENGYLDYADLEKKSKGAPAQNDRRGRFGLLPAPLILNASRRSPGKTARCLWWIWRTSRACGRWPAPEPRALCRRGDNHHPQTRGPRGGLILCREEYAKAIDKAIFPGTQGGPLEHIIAAKAVLRRSAEAGIQRISEEYRRERPRAGPGAAGRGAGPCLRRHRQPPDDRGPARHGRYGQGAGAPSGRGAHHSKQKTPFPTTRKPFVTSGVRIGTPAVTTRGFGPEEMRKIAKWIAACTFDFEAQKEAVAAEVAALTARFPLYE